MDYGDATNGGVSEVGFDPLILGLWQLTTLTQE
jgi:hypothetical protein